VDWFAVACFLSRILTGWQLMPGCDLDLHGLRRYHQGSPTSPKLAHARETHRHVALTRLIPSPQPPHRAGRTGTEPT
jgi:hypothetical protein